MEVMILAAGLGSRLKKLTSTTPKCLIEVAGKPILQWHLENLKDAGASKIVINLHHLSEQVVSFVEQHNTFGCPVVFSEEPELFNTGGGLKYAEHHFSLSSPILVMNGDILSSLSLKSLYTYHTQDKGDATLVTQSPRESRVLLFENSTHALCGWRNNETKKERLIAQEGTLSERGFCGIQVISPVIFEYLGRPQEKRSLIAGYLDAADTGKKIVEYISECTDDIGYWFDIGTPEQLNNCRQYFKQRTI